MQEAKKRLGIFIILILCISSLLCLSEHWKAEADGGDKNITLNCEKDGSVIEGMKWKLYRTGERQGGDFVLTGDFAAYPVDLKDMSVENISAAAQTLSSYAVADHIACLAEGITDESGKLTFNGLSDGLYMAVGKRFKIGEFTYEPTPLLLEVSKGSVDFSYDAYPKIVRVTLSSEARSHTVKKVWLDYDDLYEARPTYVTVDLFRDDELYDTVTLNEANNWEYRWYELDSRFEWRVVERKIPVDYEVRIEYNETQYLIRNRHNTITDWGEYINVTTTTTQPPVITGTETTAVSTTSIKGQISTQTESTTDIDGGNYTNSTPTTTTSTVKTTDSTLPPATTSAPNGGGGKLPQTGQLWWPVFPLGIGGTLMIFSGIAIHPKKEENEEDS